MKRTIILAVSLSCLAASAVTATAAPKAKASKPVAMTWFFHGSEQFGELENANLLEAPEYATMDAKAPTGTSARSAGVTNYTAGPNTNCAGNTLFPIWTGALDGAPTGDATVDLVLQVAGSGNIEVRLFADVFGQACNEAYEQPLGSATVAVASGQTSAKVVLKGINKKKRNITSLMVQVSPASSLTPPFITRIQYDAAAAMSKVSFTCLPKAGKKAC